jgi:site-specific DNA recombinase
MAKRPTPARTGAIRCAVYTRKSTEEGLEQAFNSLDAQREACEAYIVSQKHEGWVLLAGAYDDGGFSGGTMERPGLKRLLADVEVGRVDVIVVYKVDRLTRALSDFAKIVEVLDARGASFVSVTQAFNTTTSMGRLTLNVLLSFAQFEREVTGERIRDKIAASKKKGMWMGGPVPLGYRVEERKLLIDDAEAVLVRHIFTRYVALGSGRALIEELRSDGYRTRVRPRSKGGPPIGGVPFERGMLFSMLANRIYLGEIVHKGTSQPGEHDAIIASDLWEAIQQTLQANRVSRKERHNARIPSLLAGRLFDSYGRRMSPSHAVKSGKRYRYYITHASELRDGGPDACRLPAGDIEMLVVERLRALLTDRSAIARLGDLDARASSAAIDTAAIIMAKLDTAYGRTSLVGRLVVEVRLGDSEVGITIDRPALQTLLGIGLPQEITDEPPLVITTSAVRVRHGKDVKLVLAVDSDIAAARDPQLLDLLAEARDARDAVLAAPDKSIKEIARADGQCRTRMARLVRLSWLAPEIVEAIVDGRHPARLTPRMLLTTDLPIDWRAQKVLLGIR